MKSGQKLLLICSRIILPIHYYVSYYRFYTKCCSRYIEDSSKKTNKKTFLFDYDLCYLDIYNMFYLICLTLKSRVLLYILAQNTHVPGISI